MSRYFNDFSDTNGDSLEHHGILGMKWGVRRYQNKDGSLTSTGKERLKKSRNTPPNTKLLNNYSGPAMFISDKDNLTKLNPRVPDNFFTKMSRYFNDFSDTNGDSLEHHGILGMKCGVRHYQNKDVILTPEGHRRRMYRDRSIR